MIRVPLSTTTSMCTAAISTMTADTVATVPVYLPSMNSTREIGLARSARRMPRSFSMWNEPAPSRTMSTTANIDTAASPMSMTIFCCAPTASGESTYEEPISSTPNRITTSRMRSCR